ncbi:MAG: CPBP family glutamic-type intramembrane protease, partial [Cyclobacteriaceae bacterium]
IQQFLVVGLVAGNMRDLEGKNVPLSIIVVVTSITFSVVHLPSLLLVLATLLLAIVYTLHYLRTRNLWTLGLFHGWLGGLFYFIVLGRDPWVEVFSGI